MFIRLTIAFVVGLVASVLGGIVGAILAGNYAVDFELFGLRGYEAGAFLGELAGFLGGFLAATWTGFLVSHRAPPR